LKKPLLKIVKRDASIVYLYI